MGEKQDLQSYTGYSLSKTLILATINPKLTTDCSLNYSSVQENYKFIMFIVYTLGTI